MSEVDPVNSDVSSREQSNDFVTVTRRLPKSVGRAANASVGQFIENVAANKLSQRQTSGKFTVNEPKSFVPTKYVVKAKIETSFKDFYNFNRLKVNTRVKVCTTAMEVRQLIETVLKKNANFKRAWQDSVKDYSLDLFSNNAYTNDAKPKVDLPYMQGEGEGPRVLYNFEREKVLICTGTLKGPGYVYDQKTFELFAGEVTVKNTFGVDLKVGYGVLMRVHVKKYKREQSGKETAELEANYHINLLQLLFIPDNATSVKIDWAPVGLYPDTSALDEATSTALKNFFNGKTFDSENVTEHFKTIPTYVLKDNAYQKLCGYFVWNELRIDVFKQLIRHFAYMLIMKHASLDSTNAIESHRSISQWLFKSNTMKTLSQGNARNRSSAENLLVVQSQLSLLKWLLIEKCKTTEKVEKGDAGAESKAGFYNDAEFNNLISILIQCVDTALGNAVQKNPKIIMAVNKIINMRHSLLETSKDIVSPTVLIRREFMMTLDQITVDLDLVGLETSHDSLKKLYEQTYPYEEKTYKWCHDFTSLDERKSALRGTLGNLTTDYVFTLFTVDFYKRHIFIFETHPYYPTRPRLPAVWNPPSRLNPNAREFKPQSYALPHSFLPAPPEGPELLSRQTNWNGEQDNDSLLTSNKVNILVRVEGGSEKRQVKQILRGSVFLKADSNEHVVDKGLQTLDRSQVLYDYEEISYVQPNSTETVTVKYFKVGEKWVEKILDDQGKSIYKDKRDGKEVKKSPYEGGQLWTFSDDYKVVVNQHGDQRTIKTSTPRGKNYTVPRTETVKYSNDPKNVPDNARAVSDAGDTVGLDSLKINEGGGP
jgi:hypothetical protein